MIDLTISPRAGRLIDGTGSDPIEDAVIIIEGGRIVAAGRSAAVAEAGRVGDAVERDFAGCTILPG
jgi:imidazolonepropionase-like amidohydrolase